MHLLTAVVLLSAMLLAGCGTPADIPSGRTTDSDTVAPAAYKDGREADPQQYRTDRDLCFKQVQSQTDLAMTESTNISKVRKCLIGKGYVLLG
jgi:hypothetical protein